jgi:hypothetical protein
VDAHRIDVLDEADGDHLVLAVADDFELQLLPAENRLLDQDLSHQTRAQPTFDDGAELLHVVDEPAARTSHGVGRSNHAGQTDVGHALLGFLQAVRDLALRHLDPEAVHRVLERLSVLAALDRVDLNADHLDVVLLQHARLCELGGEVEPGLSSEIGEQRVRLLLLDHLGHGFQGQGLDVGGIRHPRIRHDGGGVRVRQHDLVAKAAQRLAGLGSRVVELAGLPDDDGARPDDHDLLDVVSPRHASSPLCCVQHDDLLHGVRGILPPVACARLSRSATRRRHW